MLVSTVDLGTSLSHFYDGVYETMIFPNDQDFSDLYCDRYSSEDEALEGHMLVLHAYHHDQEKFAGMLYR
jgi:hypothetical protein